MKYTLLSLALGSACLVYGEASSIEEQTDRPKQASFWLFTEKQPDPRIQLWRSRWKGCKPKNSISKKVDSLIVQESRENSMELESSDPELPSGRSCPIQSPGGLGVEMAFLVWQSKMWGFEFAGKSMIPTNSSPPNLSLEEKVFVPDFAWRPGFKLDVNYDFDFDGWDLASRWTFYRGEDTMLKKYFDLQISPPGLGIAPLWFYPFYTVLAPDEIRFLDGKMGWNHYFNSVDLELGRLSSFTKRLSMHIFTGLKGAWMKQAYRVQYEHGSNVSAIVPGTNDTVPYSLLESAISFKNKTWGGGPRVGFDSKWKFGWGLSILANGAFSLLYSAIETHRDQNDLNLNLSSGNPVSFHMHLKTESHQLKPVVEAQLGVDWEACICKRSIIDFAIAYEIQYWWSQNELRRNYSHVSPGGTFPMRGDLQMHGLTAMAGYHY